MSLWTVAWNYLWSRKLTTTLTILSVALAVGLISAVITLRDETRARFEQEQQAYDVVVGPPGSPLQMTLNAVYFMDNPTGAMPWWQYEAILDMEDVVDAFPVGLGDTYNGFSIVGTEAKLFDFTWTHPRTRVETKPFQIAEGRFFEKPMEAVVGYRVARVRELQVGDTFAGHHGTQDIPDELNEYDHSEHEYTVVGILEPSGTSNDRAIFVDLQSIWDLHPHEEEEGAEEHDESAEDEHGHDHEDEHDHDHDDDRTLTAVLVSLDSAAYRFSFSQEVTEQLPVTAAIPVMQILRLYDQILQPAVVIMQWVGYIIVTISAISILIGLYLSIIQRKRDLAVMRALGASAFEIFGAVMIEAFLVTIMGIAAGWALGKGMAYGLGKYMAEEYGFTMAGLGTGPDELKFFVVVGMVGLLAGILPAWQAYQVDVAKDLSAN